jgi:hypothetical protein
MPAEDTQFGKGQSGNPKGRPSGPSIKTRLQRILATEVDVPDALNANGPPVRVTADEAILLKLVAKAIKGNLKAASMILDRLEGKPVTTLQAGEGTDIEIKVTRQVVSREDVDTPA